MSKLYKYPLSGFWVQSTLFGYQTPIYYQEVIAGQSLSGKLRVKVMTNSLIKAALNRMWYDTFVFYIPFRLLWEDWPAWIAGDDTKVMPTLNSTWAWNYEAKLISSTAQNAPWQRYAYNYVWNKALRSTQQAEVALTTTTKLEVLNRARSFQNQLIREAADPMPQISVDVTAGTPDTVDIEALRIAQTEYRRQRREYFFQGPQNREYLAMLESMGVQAGWEIDDEPRLIGQRHAQATFETVVATDGTNTANPSGFWSGHEEVSFGDRLIPEHGIVAAYLVPRIEFPHIYAGAVHPMLQKVTRNYYFTDGQRPHPPNRWHDVLAGISTGGSWDNQNAPAWEDYRTSVSQMWSTQDASAPWDDNYAISGDHNTGGDADELRSIRDNITTGDWFRSFLSGTEVALYTEVSGSQRSPVPPRQVNV